MKRISNVVLLLVLMLPFASAAAPGAHGPNGEHLDGPTGAGQGASVDGRPRMEAFSELFELVAHVERDRVSAMISVYETNESVDDASVELESNGTTIKAELEPATGAYHFVDQTLAERLNKPGRHSLAFTIERGEAFDIVAGAVEVEDPGHHHASGAGFRAALAVSVLVVLAIAFLFLRRIRARRAGVRQ